MQASAVNTAYATQTAWVTGNGSDFGERTICPHEALFHEGDETDCLYEVIEGVLCAYKIFADGRRQVISFAFPGDLVGFGQGNAFRFDCDAVSRSRVRVIPKSQLLRAVRENSDLGEKLLAVAAGEVANMQDHSVLLGRKSAIEKLASFLLHLAGRADEDGFEGTRVPLPMTRADIADFLGLTVETVSRNMTKLRVMRVINLPGSSIFEVLDMDRLRQIADWEQNLH